MLKEKRSYDLVGMLVYCFPHLMSATLLCVDFSAWLRLREPLWVTVTITRTIAKLLPALGVIPYPASANIYLTAGLVGAVTMRALSCFRFFQDLKKCSTLPVYGTRQHAPKPHQGQG